MDSNSNVRRQLSLTVADPALMPTAPSSVLAPYGTELQVSRGIRYVDRSIEWCPLGVFRVDDGSAAAAGALTIAATDRTSTVLDARFTTPEKSVTSNTRVQEIARLIAAALPTPALVNVNAAAGGTVPAMIWDTDRWDAIEAEALQPRRRGVHGRRRRRPPCAWCPPWPTPWCGRPTSAAAASPWTTPGN